VGSRVGGSGFWGRCVVLGHEGLGLRVGTLFWALADWFLACAG